VPVELTELFGDLCNRSSVWRLCFTSMRSFGLPNLRRLTRQW